MSSEHTSNPNYKLQKKLMRRRALRESWPLLVWLGVAALAVWAYQTGGDFQRMRGVVSKPLEIIRAPLDGILVALPVDTDLPIPRDENQQPKKLEQGIYVNRGDLVAKLDDTQLDLQISVEKETAGLSRAQTLQELGVQVGEFQTRLFQLKNERDRLEAQKLGLADLKKTKEEELLAGSGTRFELQEVQVKLNDVLGELTAANNSIEQTEQLVAAAVSGIQSLQNQVDLKPGEESAMVQLLKEQVKQTNITAGNSGFIDKVYAQPGGFVRAGDPIMDIVIQAPKTITALIPEAEALTMNQGDTVYIAIPNNRKEYVTATVLSLQQSLTQIPDYGSPIRGRMVRGRMVEFGNLGDNDEESQLPLLPGSAVIITLQKPGRIPFLSWFTE